MDSNNTFTAFKVEIVLTFVYSIDNLLIDKLMRSLFS